MKKIRRVPSLTALAVFCLAFLGAMAPPASAGSEIERGKYLATIMDCTLPGLGIFYPPNLTPDAETGLGNWSEDEIIAAVREGLRPDGRELAPIMPWHSYAVLTDPDALALARYLKSLPPASFQVPGPFGEGGTVTSPYLSVVMPQ
jgi:hypothetical protein